MTFEQLYIELQRQLVNEILTLENTEMNEDAYAMLFSQTAGSFVLYQCVLRKEGTEITATGKASLPHLAKENTAAASMRFWIQGDKLSFHLTVSYVGAYSLPNFMGGRKTMYIGENGMLYSDSKALAAISILDPIVSVDSSRFERELPFALMGGVRIAAGAWDMYTAWMQSSLYFAAEVSLIPTPLFEGAIWAARIGLKNSSVLTGILKEFVPKGDIWVELKGGKASVQGAQIINAQLACIIAPPSLGTQVELKAPLFFGDAYWEFTADMKEGLSIANLLAFAGELVHLDLGSEVLPSGLLFSNLRLYELGLGFSGKPYSLSHSWIRLGTSAVTGLALSGLELINAKLSIEADFETEDSLLPTDWSASISAMLKLELYDDLVLWLKAAIELPDLQLEAQLTLDRQSGPEVNLTGLIGIEAAHALNGALPSKANGTKIGELEVTADIPKRSLCVSGSLYDILNWQIGRLQFTVEEVNIMAAFVQETFAFQIRGQFRLNLPSADFFVMRISGGYADGAWNLLAELAQGQINIGQLLLAMLDIEYISAQSYFVLKDFALSFTTKNNEFSFQAAFYNDWGTILDGVKVTTNGRFMLRTSTDMAQPFLAVLLGLEIGPFALSAQVNDFFDDKKVSYIFQAALGGHVLRGTYAQKMVKEEIHQQLTVEFVNTTLGDIVLLLVSAVNPNHRYTLPAPWNLLNKIDLSKLRLVYDLTDDSISITYSLELSIPGIFTVTQIGLHYKQSHSGSGLQFILIGKPLAASVEETYSWDALDEAPPANLAQNDNRFTLHYLGLGQHFSTPQIKASETIMAAMAAMKESFTLEQLQFDEETNWILGIHFSLQNMLDFKLVFHDPLLYGIAITVAAEKPPLNIFNGLALMLLYKKISKDIGMFKVTLQMPERYRRLQLGAMSFTIGLVDLEVYTNKNFKLDLGFPANRDFSRSFSLEAGMYVGRGGLYFGALDGVTAKDLPVTHKGAFGSVVSLGVGLSLGIGRSFDFSVVKGGVSLEMYGIFEGVFAIFQPNDERIDPALYYSVSAVVGLVGRLWLCADLKIITVNASVEIEAYASVHMVSCQPMELELALKLKLEASIKILFIRIKFSFRFNAKLQVTIGSSSTPVWSAELPLKAESLKLSELYSAHSMRNTKQELYLQVTPIFSRAENNAPVIALIPVLGTQEFRALTATLVDWTLEAYGDIITPAITSMYGFALIAETVNYKRLTEFLSKNIVFWLTNSVVPDNGEVQEAVAMAMPPAAKIRVEAGETCILDVDYWQDNLVDGGYALRLHEYFKRLYPVPAKLSDMELDNTEQIPLAESVFLDYFQMLLRQIKGTLDGLFNEVSLPADILVELPTVCGVMPSEALAQNKTLLIEPYTEIHTQCPLTILPGESLNTLAVRTGTAFESIIEALRKTGGLLDNGAAFRMPDSRFSNRNNLTLHQIAALFFERYYRYEVPDGWQEYVQLIIAANPQYALDIEWYHSQPIMLHLMEEAEWLTMPGDTVSGLARMLALVNKQWKEFEAFDRFAEAIYQKNRALAGERLETVWIPEAEISLTGEQTLDTLFARLFPDGTLPSEEHTLASVSILKAGWEVKVPVSVSFSEPMTAAQISKTFGISMDSIAWMLGVHPERIVKNQNLCLSKIPMLQKKWAGWVLKQETLCDELGMLASRFLLQGNRLPHPQNEETQAFYELLCQQVPLVEETSHLVMLEAGEPDCVWLQGESRREYTWTEIAGELPQSTFEWGEYLRTAQQTDELRSIAKCYNPGVSFALQGSQFDGIRLFSADEQLRQDLPQISRLCVLYAGKVTDIEAYAAIYLPITVRRTGQEHVYEAEGAAPRYRSALAALAAIKSEESIIWQLCYPPSPLQNSGVLFAADWDRQNSMLLRTNLSTATHYNPVQQRNAMIQDAAALKDPMLLTLLWECSTVGGRGYRLYLTDEQGKGLPEILFDEEGATKIWLVGFDRVKEGSICKSGYANAVLAKAEKDAAFFVADGEIVQKEPALPVGCVGVDIKLAAPDEEDGSPLAKSRRLFNILNYELKGEGYLPVETATPLPPEKVAEGCWNYKLVLPLHQMMENSGQSPYAALGTIPAVRLRCTDVLGNYAAQKSPELLLTPVYNDRLYGLNEWPCITLRFRIDKINNQAHLLLEMAAIEENKPDNPDAAVEKLERSLCQLAQKDVEAKLICTIGNQSWRLTGEILAAILDYGESLRAYLLNERACPAPFQQSFVIDYSNISGIFPLTVAITMQRTHNLPQDVSLCTVQTEILPDIKVEGVGKSLPAFDFAAAFERAIPNVKLARPDKESAALYAVTVGDRGALPRLTIKPRQIQEIVAPTYSAVRPLDNQWISRELEVQMLDKQGNWTDEPQKLRLTGIDMDIWKANLLQDIEKLLNHENAYYLALEKPELFNSLTNIKRNLAKAIQESLTPLAAESMAEIKGAKSLFTENLYQSLQAEDSLACIAEYTLEWENQAPEQLRMEAALVSNREASIEKDGMFTANPGKLDTASQSFCIQYIADSPLFTGYMPDYKIQITELEYHILANEHGYESSSWLQFIIPLEDGDGILHVSLESGLRVPNPLRRCPVNPELIKQSAVFDKEVLYNWCYQLTCAAELMEQDQYQIEVAFSRRELFHLEEEEDLFGCLACYNVNRTEFYANLFGGKGDAFINTVSHFVELLQCMVELWPKWLEREKIKWMTAADIYSTQVNVTFHPQPKLHVNSSWKNADAVFETECPEAGVKTPFTLRLPDINVYQYHIASPAIKTVRNANLLEPLAGKTLAVDERFIYRSQRLVMSELYAGCEVTIEKLVGTIVASGFEEAVERAVEQLFMAIGTGGQQVQVSMAITYAYQLGNSYVELPVAMFLPTDAEKLPIMVNDTIIAWQNAYMMEQSECTLLFRVNINHPATGDVLLGYTRLRINLSYTPSQG